MRYKDVTQIRLLTKHSLIVGDIILMDVDLNVKVIEIIGSRLTNNLKFDYQIKVQNINAV